MGSPIVLGALAVVGGGSAGAAAGEGSWLLLTTYVVGALGFSFMCSILEATMLSTSVVELADRKEQGDTGAGILLAIKQERVDDAISSILTLNTIAHTVGAVLAGAEAARVFGETWVGIFSAILTFLVLIVTEIIPKTLGTVYASRLAGLVGRILDWLTWIFAPVLVLTRALTGLMAHGEEKEVSRGELAALVQMASRQGILAGQEAKVLFNALKIEDIRVADVMTPRTVAVMLPADTPLGELPEHEELAHYSRVPLFEETRDHVTGYFLQRDALAALTRDASPESPVSEWSRDVVRIPEIVPVAQGLKTLLESKAQLAVAVDEFGGMSGIITVEDILETLLGTEIMDELDRVPDLRALAAEKRDRRLKDLPGASPEAHASPDEADDRENTP